MTTPIPQPPSIPFLGHVGQVEFEAPLRSFQLLAKSYGDIYQLNLAGNRIICINSYAMANELSDEKRFRKKINPSLEQVRNLVSDGLFTAHHDEPNWALAHRILMPAFGQANIRNMLEDMRDIASQLILKWERFGPDALIEPADDFTRLAFDAVALCSMSYRLNSFYSDTAPPFVKAMGDFLTECSHRTKRPSIVQALMSGKNAQYAEDIKLMTDIATNIISERKARPTTKKDLLSTMLYSKDPKTGEGLADDNIARNLITFLIAGHETSSGLMTFMTYYLLKHPETMRKLRHEVDTVLGGRPIQYEDLSKLPYLVAVMRETLRLAPPATARGVTPIEDTVIGGKYFAKAGSTLIIQTFINQRDPLVWGDDANDFKPERMLDGKFEAMPPNSWQPFGAGLRACIGRPFAWQEVILTMASIVQKFDLSMADPSYTLVLQQSMTIKPKAFKIRAALRSDGPRLHASPSSGLMVSAGDESGFNKTPSASATAKMPIYVLYGSNTGTSESFAQRIVNEAPSHGFGPQIGSLDSSTGQLPTDGPVIIITASFEGQPADNAGRFVDWLTSLHGDELKDVRFTVFGCGNSDWVQTYQRIPILCDEHFEKFGGKRILKRGEGDASQGNFFSVFDRFESDLWKALAKEYGGNEEGGDDVGFEVKTVDPGTERTVALRQSDTALGTVVENRILTSPGTPSKLHLEFKLPEGQSYRAGDYLAILPHNPPRDVHRVLSHFGLTEDHRIVISSDGPTSLPIEKPVTVFEILRGYVELSQPATSRDIKTLTKYTSNESIKSQLRLLSESYDAEILGKRVSVLDILEKYSGDIKLPLSSYLRMLPPMRVRQYSISSSSLWNAENVILTISVLESPALSENTKTFLGVASNYLSQLRPGDKVQMSVRPSAVAFHPPDDPSVPVVMFCAGSGLAPMRGFMQERAMQKKSGREVGRMVLFFGCRSKEVDYLYSDTDLKEWAELGFLDIRPAFSRATEESEGCKYVQDRIWHDKEDVIKLYAENAKFFTCGSAKVAKGIKGRLIDILAYERQMDQQTAEAKIEIVLKGRYATDIFD